MFKNQAVILLTLLTFDDTADRLPRNVGYQLPTYAVVTSQKSEHLIYPAAEVGSLTCI